MNAHVTTDSQPLRNITPFDEVALEIEDLFEEAAHWADGSPVENQAQCDALDVLDKNLLDASKRLDALRVEEKRPLDEQVQAIQDRYNPFIQPKKGKVDIARAALNPLRAAWKEKERQRKEAEAQKAREEAEAARIEAERLIRESAGNLTARVDAEHMLSGAKIAERDAKKAVKAATTGLGLRKSYQVEVSDLNEAVKYYWRTSRAEFSTLIAGLAMTEVQRGARMIPGITITEIRKAL
ncbi:MAG: hypothetical protein JWR51_4669 [Devosia sp.]|uniref:hypothetical protein n=1 Tax=Devosia sp. TaxID=1871048 RepID=UPI00260511F9|nr:hypothetical protein [Devosia sp.]MDB5531566.1 hypothetical protein [Devosia sp.]